MFDILKNAHDLNLLEARLVEWGRWIQVGSGCGVGYGTSPVAAIMRDNVGDTSRSAPMISDDEAEFIGDAIMQLNKSCPHLADAVVNYYATRAKTNYQTLGRDLNVSRIRASELIAQALTWLQGYVCAGLRYAA